MGGGPITTSCEPILQVQRQAKKRTTIDRIWWKKWCHIDQKRDCKEIKNGKICVYVVLYVVYIYILYLYGVYVSFYAYIYICTLYINLYPSPFLVHVTNSCKLSLSNHQPSPPSKQKSQLRFTSKWSCHRAFSWSLWVSMEGLHRVAQDHSSTFQQTCVFLVERQSICYHRSQRSL